MLENDLECVRAAIARIPVSRPISTVAAVDGQTLIGHPTLSRVSVGDRATVHAGAHRVGGEVIRLSQAGVVILLDVLAEGVGIGDRILFDVPPVWAPHQGWIGRVLDPDGQPLDGAPILPGMTDTPIEAGPPPPNLRGRLGQRLQTGMAVFNTMLPIVRGQRMGLFAGSGVGKSTLIADLARGFDADVVVIALVGERGREVRHFVDEVLGPAGMARAVVIAATSDRAASVRRRCAPAAMAVAEYFRDLGLHVCLFVDSITRFCEAHREVAVAQGETAGLRGYPASTATAIAKLCERAGPGVTGSGTITAVFSVLVAGSDMDEPVADMLRGVLDGHIVLDRAIAERGRFPAIDVVRSVSRALPEAANAQENRIIQEARHMMSVHDRAALMIQTGLYEAGADPAIDKAVACHEALEQFVTINDGRDALAHFAKLRQALGSSPMQSDTSAVR